MGNFSGREEDGNLEEDFVPRHPSGRTVGGPSRFESRGFQIPGDEKKPGGSAQTGTDGGGNPMDLQGSDAMELEEGGTAEDDGEQEELVPTVFRWEHGGRQVYITGTFNNWEKQLPMHRSGNDFTYIHNLTKGKHAYKFIVDDEWRFAPDQPTVADVEGRVNNFIDVAAFRPYTGDDEDEAAPAAAGGAAGGGAAQGQQQLGGKAEEEYSQWMPDLDEYTKEPPPLPPHLRHIILNKSGMTPARPVPQAPPPPQALGGAPGAPVPVSVPAAAAAVRDPAALPPPQHVALNHLYCTAIKDGMMVLGMTQRYKSKFVTTVYYSTMPST
mmetsp:Transcript_28802/g.49934  ORF Transcript_28802/g.49934 Transcript_28802/m.49934 type:complete len:326 (-) Transcript_28802:329-1306(-)